MTRLSVNINKIATIRNARGGNIPNVVDAAKNCEKYGAEGITVHPRPDERHIKYQDVLDLKQVVSTEYNIEGYPSKQFVQLIMRVKPNQVTLVPDPPDALTSNQGWDAKEHLSFLTEIINEFQSEGIRTSIFMDTNLENIDYAAKTGTDRIELYTEPYASMFENDKDKAISAFISAAERAKEIGLGLNAGHDLNLDNLRFFSQNIPGLLEVSIGHALISDALYFGLEETIRKYKDQLK